MEADKNPFPKIDIMPGITQLRSVGRFVLNRFYPSLENITINTETHNDIESRGSGT